MRAWCNGSLVQPEAPALSVLDHGVTVGDGVFETIKIVDNQAFALTRHLRRLARSARGLGLVEPDHEVVRDAIKQTMADQDLPFGRIRVTYTGGISPLGSLRGNEPPSLMVVSAEAAKPSKTTAAVTVPWPRNEHSAVVGLKTTSYAANAVAVSYAADRDASEAILANTAGNLCEGTGSNVFCVVDGQVVTPTLGSGCLAGVTRALVIEWFDVHERDLTMEEFADADEVFLTSTTRDIQGVRSLDGREMRPGEVTAAMAEEWARRESLDVDP